MVAPSKYQDLELLLLTQSLENMQIQAVHPREIRDQNLRERLYTALQKAFASATPVESRERKQLDQIYTLLQKAPISDIAKAIYFDQQMHHKAEREQDVLTRAVAKAIKLRAAIREPVKGDKEAFLRKMPGGFESFLDQISKERRKLLTAYEDIPEGRGPLIAIGRFLGAGEADGEAERDLELFLKRRIPTIFYKQDHLVEQILQERHGTSNIRMAMKECGHTIRALHLHDEKISLVFIQELVKIFPNLIELHLIESDLGNEHLSEIARLTQLKVLHLSGNRRINDDGVALLAPLTQLESLHLRGCTSVTAGALQAIGKLSKIHDLDLTECELTNEGLRYLKPLTFRSLFIGGENTTITDDGIIELLHTQSEKKNESVTLEKFGFCLRAGVTKEATRWLQYFPKLVDCEINFLHFDKNFVFHTQSGTFTCLKLLDIVTWYDLQNSVEHLLSHLPLEFFENAVDFIAPVIMLAADGRYENINSESCKKFVDRYGHKVKNLAIQRTKQTAQNMKEFVARFPHLTELNLSGCVLDIEGLREILKLKELKIVNLFAAPAINDDTIAMLSSLTHLENISLTACDISDVGIASLSALRALRVLNVSLTKVTGTGFKNLSAKLEEVVCEWCERMTDKTLAVGLSNKSKLKKLEVRGTPINGTALKDLSYTLEEFDCSVNRLITDRTLVVGLRNKPNLKRLTISATAITGAVFGFISDSIERIDCGFTNVTSKSILEGLARMQKLTRLDIMGCRQLDQETVRQFQAAHQNRVLVITLP